MNLAEEASVYANEDKLTLHSDINQWSLPLRLSSFYSEKDFDKFIKCVERIVRSSSEYKQWVSYLIESLGNKECALTNENINETNVEIHHHPISLYTICKSIIVSKIDKGLEFCTFDIATETIELHFKNKVGYIQLLSDLHTKYHSGFLDLPIELVQGDYKYILNNYPIDENDRERIYSLCSVTQDNSKIISWKNGEYPGLKVVNS